MSEPLSLTIPLAQRLAEGGLGLALIVQKVDRVDIALAARAAGCDAVVLDLEHSVIAEGAAAQVCIAALQAGVAPLVRVAGHDPNMIGRLLDAGAVGIVAPHVESAAEARAIVAAVKFAPEGTRSVSYHWPHFDYRPHDAGEMRRAMNAATLVIAMVESPQACARADEIAAVPGVDVVHVGSMDLADALGVPGRVDDPRVLACQMQVIEGCRRHGKVAGMGGVGGQAALAARLVEAGTRFITAGVEWDLLLAATRQRLQSLRALEPTRAS